MNAPTLLALVIAFGVIPQSSRIHAQAPPATKPQPTAAQPSEIQLTPSDLFENLSKVTKPLWRQQYRSHIERTVTSRPKASMALGALMADLALAGMARDAQQIHNLVQDQEALEKLLGIADKMRSSRQRYVMTADSGDWPNIARGIEKAHEKQLGFLIDQRDNALASLVTTGRWVRTWQICTTVVVSKKLEDDLLAVGNVELVANLNSAIDTLATKAPTGDKCIRVLSRKIGMIDKLWKQTGPQEQRQERLQVTKEILDELISLLVQDQPASARGAGAKPASADAPAAPSSPP